MLGKALDYLGSSSKAVFDVKGSKVRPYHVGIFILLTNKQRGAPLSGS